jgi:hypothetical protein
MKFSIMIATLAAAVLPGIAAAQTMPSDAAGARIDQRQANQAQRIDQGVKSGELNAREAARMQKGQTHVQNMENRARADGKVTKGEARRIQGAQNVQSARIYTQKHDKQKAAK